MSTEVKLPELGENVESGDLVKLLVHVGEQIKKDQPIMELETDKATIEVPSPSEGTVSEIRVKEGEKLKVGQSLLVLEDGAGAKSAAPQPKVEEAEKPRGKRKPESTVMSKSAEPAEAAEEGPERASEKALEQPTPRAAAPAGGGATVEVKVPEMGENITSGDLVKVLVKVGDRVAKDQGIVEVETDKATIEVPSSAEGTVKEIRVQQGQKLKAGDVILILEGAAGAPAEPASPVESPKSEATRPDSSTVMSKSAEPAERAEEPPPGSVVPPASPMARYGTAAVPSRAPVGGKSPADVPAAPSVRALAREIGVEITEVQGTGPSGRVTRDDVKRHARERSKMAAAGPGAAMPLPDFAKWGEIERQPMSAIRRATARNMGYAWAIPHVTQNDKADITSVEKLREKFAQRAEAAGGKLTMTAIGLKVVAAALRAFPKFAASLDLQNEQIVLKKYVHIGVAVDTERGLLVPVIRDVDKKNIVELSVELSQIAQKAKARKLGAEDMEGGVFTITNLGGIGGTFFSPIINAPQVAILGMGRSEMEPRWIDNQWKPRLMLPLSVSYDHRIIDGAETARFLRWLAEAFEQPFLLALEG